MKSSEFFNGIIKTINTANKTITPFISDTTAPNSLDGSIGKLNTSNSVGTKTKNVDFIKDEDINALATNYNKATIGSTLPSNSTGAANKCCQKGMSCMTKASGRPSLQPCGDQTANKNCSKRQ